MAGRIIVTGSEDSRGFYPYECAVRLARHFGTQLVELPGNHAGMIQHPVQFAPRLRSLLHQPASRAPGDAEVTEEVTK
jgi:acetyltransferase/esterase